jgi:hypothetical protein
MDKRKRYTAEQKVSILRVVLLMSFLFGIKQLSSGQSAV